jgi:hypothetical protein
MDIYYFSIVIGVMCFCMYIMYICITYKQWLLNNYLPFEHDQLHTFTIVDNSADSWSGYVRFFISYSMYFHGPVGHTVFPIIAEMTNKGSASGHGGLICTHI